MLRVVPVTNPALEREFVEFPYRLYAGDALWVPPLRSDVHKIISHTRNPFFREAEICNWVALDPQHRALGRISATVHPAYNQRHGAERAMFGFFESVPDGTVAKALLCTAETWSRERGKTQMLGPYSYTSTQDAALLIDNFDGRPPTVLQTYNPPHYRELLERAGYTLDFTFTTYGVRLVPSAEFDRLAERAAVARSSVGLSVRPLTARELEGHAPLLLELFNASFAGNREVTPVSAPVFRFALDSMRALIDPAGVRMIERDGQAVAFFAILPDLNEILIRLGGRIGLMDLLFRLRRYRREVRKCVIALIGARPELVGRGLGRVLASEMVDYTMRHYEECHTMWIDDRNPFSFNLARAAGMKPTKRYGVFRRAISPVEAAQ